MKRNTIQRGISGRTVAKDSTLSVLNEEAIPVLSELRIKANLELRETSSIVTDGLGTWIELWRSPELETTGTYSLFADVNASNSDNSDWMRVKVSNAITTSAGVVTLSTVDQGSVWRTSFTAFAQWTADAVNRQAVLQVRDGTTGAILTAKAVVTMGAREV